MMGANKYTTPNAADWPERHAEVRVEHVATLARPSGRKTR